MAKRKKAALPPAEFQAGQEVTAKGKKGVIVAVGWPINVGERKPLRWITVRHEDGEVAVYQDNLCK